MDTYIHLNRGDIDHTHQVRAEHVGVPYENMPIINIDVSKDNQVIGVEIIESTGVEVNEHGEEIDISGSKFASSEEAS